MKGGLIPANVNRRSDYWVLVHPDVTNFVVPLHTRLLSYY